MVYRVFVEKKPGLDNEAKGLLEDIKELLGIKNIENLRLFNRYDAEGMDKELFDYSVKTVFSEPQLDNTTTELPKVDAAFAVEYLPGQFDQRAASAAECIQMVSRGERPTIKTAKVYALYGKISDEDINAVKKFVINGVESREASMDVPESLIQEYDIPDKVEVIDRFLDFSEEELEHFIADRGLAMDLADIKLCQEYFRTEKRNPTVTEIKMIDTYWSDHCRHTTFNTIIDNVMAADPVIKNSFERYLNTRRELNRKKPVTLMDMGTIAAKYLKNAGKLDKLDESDEINACTVRIKVDVEGELQDWLLLFKNETHNHPTEIEPFGGAATCLGGAIRDPLSGRSYVYSAMRVTGAGDPLVPVKNTIEGKLPQRTLVKTAANGYSSYGNQIGVATGQVEEIYHPGYVAKRMEIGAVMAAAPEENVIRMTPAPGDKVILLGGKTGRDGCGGATGSSKSHKVSSLENCGAEVQKGNAPEERKLQRLFRNAEASRMIKRCNDFGAGGVSVAIGELAPGLNIDLNKVPKKYEGLDGTELAISESQERMACVVSPDDVNRFLEIAYSENLEATVVATVTQEPRLVLNWNGEAVVDISREFLDTNGAEKHIEIETPLRLKYSKTWGADFAENMKALADDLNVCSKRGLGERFDSTIGAGTVLMPFGGKYQRTPIQTMVNKVSVEKKNTRTVSMMAYGFNPFIMEKDPYSGAYLSVLESLCKLVAAGGEFKDVFLSFQEYFEKLGKNSKKWGMPLAAMLGALDAQLDYEVAAIGGKDSMSGTFEDMHVPPTLVSFAVTTDDIDNIISPEFKKAGNKVIMLIPDTDTETGLPVSDSVKAEFKSVSSGIRSGNIVSCYTPGFGGAAEAVLKMCFGNGLGFRFNDRANEKTIFDYQYGSFICEVDDFGNFDYDSSFKAIPLGEVTEDYVIRFKTSEISISELSGIYEKKLEPVYSCNISQDGEKPENLSFVADKKFASSIKTAAPKVLIPVFPGTNCEFDTAKAFSYAGAETETFVINNLTPSAVSKSVEEFAKLIKKSQIVFIPGGFSGGDEPDGSGKFITAFFRNAEVKEAVTELLEKRDGLMGGICNGFQALIKLGLVPYGRIIDTDESCATLTFNRIGRHQSKLVRTRVASNNSPWMSEVKVGDIYTVPVSHGEGRFISPKPLMKELIEKGQIITQYVDLSGSATNDIQFNPNGSDMAVEGIVSPDGRVLGKMGHSERTGYGLYKNVPGEFDMKLFSSAVNYFR